MCSSIKKIHILFRLEQEPTAQIRDDKGTTKILERFVHLLFRKYFMKLIIRILTKNKL